MNHAQAIAQLQALAKGAQQAMKVGELKVAEEIVADAKLAAPGSLPSHIYATQTETETVVVGGPDISAYVEFGTGNFAKEYVQSLPPEWKEEAIKFFITGKGHGAPQPFFFPAVLKHQDEILTAVEQELMKLTK
jgi:hypothetical protein